MIKQTLIKCIDLGYRICIKGKYAIGCLTSPKLKIMTVEDTILYLLKGKSCARYGDGEFKLMDNKSINFQSANAVLAQRLRDTLDCYDPDILICLPSSLNSTSGMTKRAAEYWINFLVQNRKKWMKQLDTKRVYGDAFISRPYMDRKNKESSMKVFSSIRQLWDKRDVVIVEGEQTRFGIGNTLLDNANNIRRILCTQKNAFEQYDLILTAIDSFSRETLIILALGPTATVLVPPIHAKGFQALDLGHLDIEYEWYLMKTTTKVQVEGKYTNEAVEKKLVLSDDPIYREQIYLNLNELR